MATEHLLVPFFVGGVGRRHTLQMLSWFLIFPRNMQLETAVFLVKSTFLPSLLSPLLCLSRPAAILPGFPHSCRNIDSFRARLADMSLHLK